MAKITRKSAKIFGSSAGANQIAEFGSLAASAPVFSTDPATIQSLANWLTGWFGAVIGSNSPAIEDMNAFCYVMAYQIAYGFQAGVAEWDSGTTYFIGSVVNSSGVLFVSLTDNNLNNAVTSSTNWKLYGRAQRTVTANTSATTTDDTILCNTAIQAINVTLPAANSVLPGKRISIKKISVDVNLLSILPTGADLLDTLPLQSNPDSGASWTWESDGVSNWYNF